jgi:hypothetical protein
MEEKYFIKKNINLLCNELCALTEVYVYLSNLEPTDKEYSLLEELSPAFDRVGGAMEDFFTHYLYNNSQKVE